jgi:2-polyprenyl-6-methoxyphenol hydroxylase-like FAD-dependent oxidoreductase
MPQWDFLDFLRDEAAAFPAFRLKLDTGVSGMIEEQGRITGVKLSDGGHLTARKLVIVADGRNSIVRRDGWLTVTELGAPIDVFWFRVPKQNDAGGALRGVVAPGTLMALIDRGDYWQCAYVFPKGRGEQLRRGGIAALRDRIEQVAPILGPLGSVLTGMDQMHLLTVALDRLDHWQRPGLLAIGDAAHAMSPVGGIGINLAIQDAVAAANLLAEPLRRSGNVDGLLAKVEARRMLSTRIFQRGQKFAHDNVIDVVLQPNTRFDRPAWQVRLLNRCPLLRRIPGRIIGLGVRRERVRSPLAALRRSD